MGSSLRIGEQPRISNLPVSISLDLWLQAYEIMLRIGLKTLFMCVYMYECMYVYMRVCVNFCGLGYVWRSETTCVSQFSLC